MAQAKIIEIKKYLIPRTKPAPIAYQISATPSFFFVIKYTSVKTNPANKAPTKKGSIAEKGLPICVENTQKSIKMLSFRGISPCFISKYANISEKHEKTEMVIRPHIRELF